MAIHLAGPEHGGLVYDIRRPKHPFTDKFMLAGGHTIPTCYALWMILYEAMARQHAGNKRKRNRKNESEKEVEEKGKISRSFCFIGTVLNQAPATGDDRYKCDPEVAILAVDALGFRRSSGALKNLLKKEGLEEEELFKQAKIRGIRALMGHAETTDVTNDGWAQ